MAHKQYYIFLDDIRQIKDCLSYKPHPKYLEGEHVWLICRDYDEFVRTIESNGVPTFISFDHDLAGEHYRPSMYDEDRHYSNYYTDGTFKEKTGYECAKWLVDYCMDHGEGIPEFTVHSMNPIGASNITEYLSQAQKYIS